MRFAPEILGIRESRNAARQPLVAPLGQQHVRPFDRREGWRLGEKQAVTLLIDNRLGQPGIRAAKPSQLTEWIEFVLFILKRSHCF
jgi:hypothetical protein